ncbi:LacI family DNA-binding transcriptional regulator [Fictibacillus phosphorivorans]|uniref:LacI family DNA-binding transcriptional regulator n=1 Tax=Fictibacillus phosphorivorans TaxID=1221500 RepID=UPI00203A614A|nr:LacI family DNA-binding transcriptional regulator [Fictibacillus phosphorivorans]MCM3717471.1 LacI family transcriptional regulator [Fictibacillus phosphorivorans]MCM3775166.1 LacI family transcriptional regulator [Fictibacillus phosphorivorans]
MATIQDVAKLAGLSRTTVSRVINNHPYVTEEKKRLVSKAMQELNYVPNSSARRLRRQQTETIAVYVPRITNPFFSHLVEVMEKEAAKKGYQLILCQTRYKKQQERNFLELLKTKQVDGLILTSIENDWSEIEPYLAYGPIVMCNEYNDTAQVPIVFLDQIKGGYIGTKHLIEKGYTKLGFCTGNHKSSRLAHDRHMGFLKALNEAGLQMKDEWFFSSTHSIQDGKSTFEIIKELSDPPEAIFTGSDEVAAGLVKAATDEGWKVPEDLAVIGFDNQPLAELMELTTVEQPIETIASQTMELMIESIKSKRKSVRKEVLLPFNMIQRSST